MRERFINAGDDYERRHGEPLGLLMVQNDESDLVAGTRQLVLKHYAMHDPQRYSLGMDKLNQITTRPLGSYYGEWHDGKRPSQLREVYLTAAVLGDRPAESTFKRLTKDASTHFGGVPWPIVNLFPADSWADSHYRWLWCLFDAAWPNAVDNPLNAGRWFLKSASPPWQDYLYLDWKDEQVLPGCFLSRFDDYYNASVAFIDWLLCVDESKTGGSGAGGKPAKGKKAGHRRTNEELFKAAMRTHHKYEAGSVLNVEPTSPRQIEALMGKGISDTTAGRLLKKHFGSIDQYRNACFSGAIGPKLVVLLGDGLHAFGSFDATEHDVENAADNDSDE